MKRFVMEGRVVFEAEDIDAAMLWLAAYFARDDEADPANPEPVQALPDTHVEVHPEADLCSWAYRGSPCRRYRAHPSPHLIEIEAAAVAEPVGVNRGNMP